MRDDHAHEDLQAYVERNCAQGHAHPKIHCEESFERACGSPLTGGPLSPSFPQPRNAGACVT
jgi:hypothetical protein